MSNRHIFLAGSLCLLAFLFACNNEPDQPVAAPPDNTVDSTSAVAPSTAPTVQNEHTHTVEISQMKFNPDELTVPKGDTVVWINNDITNHCITEVNKGWTSGTLTPGQSFKQVITKSADYFCALHVVMKGKVAVQ